MADALPLVTLTGVGGAGKTRLAAEVAYDEDERWSVPNPTGREGVFEAFCPPHHPDTPQIARAASASH